MNSKRKVQNAKLNDRKKLFVFFVLLLAAYFLPTTIKAQKLDNLTDDEDAAVRDAQEMDERMNVYVHVIDRRFLALSDANAEQSKQAQKDFEKYGKLRTGAPVKLYSDIERTLTEAIGKIDDVAERDQKNPLFSKSVRILSKACERWIPQLKTFQDKATDESEKVPLANAVEDCNEIIEASAKLPKDAPKDDKKKKSKDDSN
ncbi:MAG: hypothetical protein ACR2N3_17090 [Pyrinomonadaceae bacterium]